MRVYNYRYRPINRYVLKCKRGALMDVNAKELRTTGTLFYADADLSKR